MFPVVRRQKCDPLYPYRQCAPRREAENSGEMYWDSQLRCYVVRDIPPRRVSWRTRYLRPEANSVHDGEPYRIHDCPFCGTELPDISAIADATCSGEE